MQHPHVKAIFFAVVGYFLWSLSDVTIKLIRETHMPPYEMIAISSACGAVLLFLKAGLTGKLHRLVPRHKGPVFFRALLAVICQFCNILAFQRLSLPNFYIVAFTAPFMVAILAAVFLREKLSLAKILAISVGFMGVVIAIDPFAMAASVGKSAEETLVGYAFVAVAALAFSIGQVILRSIAHKERKDAIIFSSGIVAIAVGGACCLFLPVQPVTEKAFLMLLGASAFGVTGSFLVLRALSLAPAATVTGLHYSQFIPGVLFGYLLWDTIPKAQEIAGVVLIVASGLGMLAVSKRGH